MQAKTEKDAEFINAAVEYEGYDPYDWEPGDAVNWTLCVVGVKGWEPLRSQEALACADRGADADDQSLTGGSAVSLSYEDFNGTPLTEGDYVRTPKDIGRVVALERRDGIGTVYVALDGGGHRAYPANRVERADRA